MPSKSSSTCKRKRHANTTKYFAVPIVQWTLSWMVCQSVCSFANEDARETGMGLLTTDLSLSFLEAYRIYARRWATEVAYKDCKTLLNFGKCQSVHFAAQIASFTLTMMQYNILCTVKRFEAYETIGGLFTEVTNDTLELSVTDKIWAILGTSFWKLQSVTL